MIRLTKTGLEALLSGEAIFGNANIAMFPLINTFTPNYNTVFSSANYLYLDAGNNQVGFPVTLTSDYLGGDTSSALNAQRCLIPAGIPTTTTTGVIDSTNAASFRYWTIEDTVTGTVFGYVDGGTLIEPALTGGVTLQFQDQVIGTTEVNNGENYIFNEALLSIYSGNINNLANPVEIAIIKRTDNGNMTANDVINQTTGQNLTKLAASPTYQVVSTGVAVTSPAQLETTGPGFLLPDQAVNLPGVIETNCSAVLVMKDTDKTILKILDLNVALSGYVIINVTTTGDRVVLF